MLRLWSQFSSFLLSPLRQCYQAGPIAPPALIHALQQKTRGSGKREDQTLPSSFKRRSIQFPVRSLDKHTDFKNSPNNSSFMLSLVLHVTPQEIFSRARPSSTALSHKEGLHSLQSDPIQTNWDDTIYWSSSWAKRGLRIVESVPLHPSFIPQIYGKGGDKCALFVPWHSGKQELLA